MKGEYTRLRDRGFREMAQGHLDRAVECLARAFKIAEESVDEKLRARARCNLNHAYLMKGEIERAKEWGSRLAC